MSLGYTLPNSHLDYKHIANNYKQPCRTVLSTCANGSFVWAGDHLHCHLLRLATLHVFLPDNEYCCHYIHFHLPVSNHLNQSPLYIQPSQFFILNKQHATIHMFNVMYMFRSSILRFSPIKAVATLFNTLTIISRIELFPLPFHLRPHSR